MKLIGSYTSPFVRKISILLLEKGIEFEFVNEQPYNAENGVAHPFWCQVHRGAGD